MSLEKLIEALATETALKERAIVEEGRQEAGRIIDEARGEAAARERAAREEQERLRLRGQRRRQSAQVREGRMRTAARRHRIVREVVAGGVRLLSARLGDPVLTAFVVAQYREACRSAGSVDRAEAAPPIAALLAAEPVAPGANGPEGGFVVAGSEGTFRFSLEQVMERLFRDQERECHHRIALLEE